MSKLSKIIQNSKVTQVNIKHGDELVKFNLLLELKIDVDRLNPQIQRQPALYSFLSVLHKRYISLAKTLEKEKKRVWAERFIYYLTSTNCKYYKKMGFHPSQKIAESLVEVDELYQKSIRDLIKAEESQDILETCVKSFEQRASMLQTLSANERNEKKSI